MMPAVAVATPSVEILTAEPAILRALEVLQAMTDGIPLDMARHARATRTYMGLCEWLMLWGPGEPVRAAAMRTQCSLKDHHAIAFDLAYWSRDRKVRVSIDAPHPQRWVMHRDWPADRFRGDRPPVASKWNPKGRIIVAGVGVKARRQYGQTTIEGWEAEMMRTCKQRYGRPITYRHKKPPGQYIDAALDGVSLVVTWHSNVAVDAIRMGIPVVCHDGAAAAVCPATLPDEGQPQPLDEATRMRFLHNLAWFQWDLKTEAAACWAWLRELLT